MKNNLFWIFFILFLSTYGCANWHEKEDFIQEVAVLDSQLDGISAPFAGTHGDYIIVAGGCNFPGKPAAEGGEKKFYSGIYVIHKDSLELRKTWTKTGELPNPIAYGTSVTIPEGLLCIGGKNAEKYLDDVFLLQYDPVEHKISRITYPTLPSPTDNASGAFTDNLIYLSGGNTKGLQSSQFIKMDTEDKTTGWIDLGALPEDLPRVQPVLLPLPDSPGNKLLLTGGFSQATNNINIHTDCWVYNIANSSWHECSTPHDKEKAITFTGATGTITNDSSVIIIGGVNTNIFHHGLKIAMELSKAKSQNNSNKTDSLSTLNKEYLTKKKEYYQFNKKCWQYNSTQNKWQVLFEDPRIALAGAVSVSLNDKILIINGEVKPGIRTKKNYLININHLNTH